MAALFSGFVVVGGRLAVDAAAKMTILVAIMAAVDVAVAVLLVAAVVLALVS